MEKIRIGAVSRRMVQGRAQLHVLVDGRMAIFDSEQKRNYLDKFGVVFLGPEFESTHKVTIPENRNQPEGRLTLRGYTDDGRVVRLVRAFLSEIDGQRGGV